MMMKIELMFLLSAALVFPLAHFNSVEAANSPWTSSNRIAISADGNPDADADDVGATPFTLAVLAKVGLQDNLVHYDFNNFLDYKKIEPANNRMWLSAMGGQSRWGFDGSRFFDASIDPDGAVAHLAAEISKSTAGDPLYLVAAGPMELIYRALEAADSNARQHVKIVSHHNYNEYIKPRLWQRNFTNVKALVPTIGYLRIQDQNGGGLKGSADTDFHWLRDHADTNLNWVYDRIVAGKPDVSDAGMVSWLIGINGTDEVVTIAEMDAWFGADPIPTNGGSPTTPAAPAGVTPTIVPPATESIFQEVDGKIVIEAESVPLTDEWILDTTEPEYSGSGYIRWMPSWIGEISHQHRGVLIYKLRIANPGNYRMALRSSHFGAPERDKWNDCWTVMGLNPINPYGTTRKTYHSITQAQFDSGVGFTWHTTHDNYGTVANTDGHFSQPLYDLAAGDHYFWICGRSGGYRIDKIHFFKEGVSGFKSDSEPTTPILPGSNPPTGITAQMHIDGTNFILNTTNGPIHSWFSLLSKTNLLDPAWTTNQTGLPISGTGTGSVTHPITASQEFYRLIESEAPPAPVIEFIAPYYSDGPLNGQQHWNAEAGWTVSDSAGSGYASTAANVEAAVLDVPVQLSVGETYSLSINLQFGGVYSTPTGYVYTVLGGLKDSNAGASVSTDSTAADANIQIIQNSDSYRLLNNWSPIANQITTGALNAGDVLQLYYELTLGADAASTTYTVRLQNLTDGTDTGVGTVTGVEQTIYDALINGGAFGFFQSINPGNRGSGLVGVQLNSVTVTASL